MSDSTDRLLDPAPLPENTSPPQNQPEIPPVVNSSVSPEQTTLLPSTGSRGTGYQPRVNSTRFTSWGEPPSQIDVPRGIAAGNSVEHSRSSSPRRGGARSHSMGGCFPAPNTPNTLFCCHELHPWPWNEPSKRKLIIPQEQSEQWAITRRVCDLPCELI